MAAPTYVGAKKIGVGPQSTAIAPPTLYQGSTNFGVLDANSGSYGNTANPAPVEYTDQYGTTFRYVDYGGGTGEWLQKLPGGQLVKPQDAAEAANRGAWSPTPGASIQGTRSAGNSGATPGNNYFTPAGGYQAPRPVTSPSTFGTPSYQGTAAMGPSPQQSYNDLLNDTSGDDQYIAGQRQTDTDYANQIMGYLGQQTGYVNDYVGANNAALGTYLGQTGQQYNAIQALQAPTWTNYNSDPADVARQQAAYDWASGAANGSLDYQAQLANYQNASYQGYQAQYADLAQAALSQYASNPQDVQRQLTGLGNIQADIAHGGDGQRKILEQIYADIQHGGDGQRDAIERLKQELATGGNDQREVMEKYKALSNPEVTAQERYLAEIARRSFEAQDKGNREAVLSDQAARGVRSGSAEIASALGNQERFGQDRTLAELGLQANAVQRSMVALGGWQQSADSLRAAQQNGLAMYTNAQNALRAAQQNGYALAADEENALRQAQQQGLAMYQQAADSIRAMNDQVGLANTGWANENAMFNANAANQNSMFNANAYNDMSAFNANAYNSNQQFNANAYNQNQITNANNINNAYANNQNARLQGGISMSNTANSIRSANDVIGMFNTGGSQASQLAAAQFNLQKQQTLGGISQGQLGASTGVATSNFGALSGLTTLGIGNSTAIHNNTTATDAEAARRADAARQRQGIVLANAADPAPPRPPLQIPARMF